MLFKIPLNKASQIHGSGVVCWSIALCLSPPGPCSDFFFSFSLMLLCPILEDIDVQTVNNCGALVLLQWHSLCL